MRYGTIVGLMVILCTASVASGGAKKAPGKADTLANEVMSKIVYRNSSVQATVEECRLHIRFETLDAAFNLPLQGTTVVQTDTADGILVMNKNMTRTIKDRAPEAFERLTLRFHHDSIQPMLKIFSDAIATCSSPGSVVAATH